MRASRVRQGSGGVLPLLPFRQGELDGLCGIYAIVNAVRWATAKRTHGFDEAAWRRLFAALIFRAEETVGFLAALESGMDEQPVQEIARAAAAHMLAEHGIALTLTPALVRGEEASFDLLLRRLRVTTTSKTRVATLIRIRGCLDHWTVVKRVTAHSLELFDSSGYAGVRLANCRTEEEWVLGGREYVIQPQRVLLIAAYD